MSENSRLQTKLDNIVELYEQAIVLARQEEREACIKILQSFAATGKTYLTDDIIKEIAKRGEVK